MNGSGFDDVGEVDDLDDRPGLAKATVKKRSAKASATAAESPPTTVAERLREEMTKSVSDDRTDQIVNRVKELGAEEEARKREIGKLSTGFKFQMVQRGERTTLRSDLAGIVETAWVSDMNAVWTKLKKNLRAGAGKRSSHSALVRCLDDARQIAFESFSLYATARREKKRWESENDVSHGAMWNAANKVVQAEKDKGFRSKTITNEDVKAMAAVLFPDEWVAQETKKAELDLVVELIGNLAKQVQERAEDLRVLLGKHRA